MKMLQDIALDKQVSEDAQRPKMGSIERKVNIENNTKIDTVSF